MASVVQPEDELLLEACFVGDLRKVQKIIEHKFLVSMFTNETVHNIRNTYRDTHLIISARRGHVSIVSLLLSFGGDFPSFINNEGSNCLIEASCNGQLEVIKVLLNDNRINPNVQDKEGYSALLSAIGYGELDIVKELLKHPDTDINIQDENGDTPLHMACLEENFECVRLLMTHKGNPADPNIQNNQGETPLYIAVVSKNYQIVSFLTSWKHVDQTIPCNLGMTPKMVALSLAKTESVTKKE